MSSTQVRGHAAEMETSFRHHGPPDTFLCFFSSGNDEAVADTSRRVGGALWRKGALRDKLNDAVKQLQAAERGKDPELQGSACLSTGVKQPFVTFQELPLKIKL